MSCFLRVTSLSAARAPCCGILIAALAGCATIPAERGYEETQSLVESRLGTAPAWPSMESLASADADVPTTPITVDHAVRIAFIHNPEIRAAYARLGIARADLEAARRIANPSIGYARLEPSSGIGTQIKRSVSASFTELLLLPARRRLGAAELERVQLAVADELLRLAASVEVAWFDSVGADHIADMRARSAAAANNAAQLAERFFAAGNISRLQHAQEQASATHARVLSARASVDALEARSKLSSLLGLPAHLPWTTTRRLAAPLATDTASESLIQLAHEQRLDLAAAKQEVALREDALAVVRRWRWLGRVVFGYQHESEPEGGALGGPSLTIELPIFNQGQDAIMRAEATLTAAQARHAALLVDVDNHVRLGIESTARARDIAEQYRTALVPQREAIVAGTQAEVNFMLAGVFELIAAKQAEYDAYQGYLESVRDYWTARARLRGAVGGRLPDDDTEPPPTIGVDALPRRSPASTTKTTGHLPSDAAVREPMAAPGPVPDPSPAPMPIPATSPDHNAHGGAR